MHGPVLPNGALSEASVLLLHAVSDVDCDVLRAARIRPSHANWLHAPWYPAHRGGAITVGRTIWFTRGWFDPMGLGDGSLRSTHAWLLHLAHEVGHLAQARRFGPGLLGKARYVAAFTRQYAWRALLLRWPVHDGSPLEQEAEEGRQVLLRITAELGEQHPLILAVHEGDAGGVCQWCTLHATKLAR